jgi:hypothetical protein
VDGRQRRDDRLHGSSSSFVRLGHRSDADLKRKIRNGRSKTTTPFEMFGNETLRDFESLRSADADSVRHGTIIDGVACPVIVSAFAVRLIQSRDGVTSIEVEMHHNRIRTQKNTKIHERNKNKS